MDLSSYLRAFRRLWWVVLLTAVITTALAAGFAFSSAETYAAKVTFFATTPATDSNNALEGDTFGRQRVNSYVRLLTSDRLVKQFVTTAGVDLSTADAVKEISGEADLNTVLVSATVTDTSKKRSLDLASAIATDFPRLVGQIESLSGKQKAPVTLAIVSGPTLQPAPVGPNKKLDVAVGVLVGLVLGALLVIWRAVTDDTIRDLQVEDSLPVPVLGTYPVGGRTDGTARGARARRRRSRRSESFRLVRANLGDVGARSGPRVFVLTPVGGLSGGEAALGLASSFASSGRTVLLVDADVRKPDVGKRLRLDGQVGLTTVLAGDASLEDAVQLVEDRRIHVLAAGPAPEDPSDLLDGEPMREVVKHGRSTSDVVLVKVPALSVSADAVVTAAYADGVIVVARTGKTRRQDLDRTLDALALAHVVVLGTILEDRG